VPSADARSKAVARRRIHCGIDFPEPPASMHVLAAHTHTLYLLMTSSAAESIVDFECDSVMIT